MLRKSLALNAWTAIFESAAPCYSSLKVTKMSKFYHLLSAVGHTFSHICQKKACIVSVKPTYINN